MIHQFIQDILTSYSYFLLIGITLFYFLFLYFGVGFTFNKTCEILFRNKMLSRISERQVSKDQIHFETRYSLQSIFIFGFSGVPVVFLIREKVINLLPDNFLNIVAGLVLLTIWNEIHFFIVHRIMHLPYFMKRVHYIHHRSLTPTVYSVYSFHWLEAFLLSTVPVSIAPFIPLSPLAIFLYPLVSILLNFAGHCNYRFGKGNGPAWTIFATRHVEHHYKGRKNYGFASNVLDWLNALLIKTKSDRSVKHKNE